MAPISINGIEFDPVADRNVMRTLGLEANDSSNSNFIIVGISGSGVTAREQEDQLARLGLVLQGYVADNTYLYRYEPADLEAIRNLDFVEWANVFMKQLKVNPALRQNNSGGARDAANLLVPSLPQAVMSNNMQEVDAMLHKDVVSDNETLLEAISTAARVPRDHLYVCRNKVRLHVQNRNLDSLANIDEIRAILPVLKPQLHNDIAREILHADVAINGTVYEGEGEVVCVADTGFDQGVANPAIVHPAFTGRVRQLYALGRPGRTDDPQGHGTHAMGSVLGDGFSATMGGRIRGAAPRATLIVQSTLDKDMGLGGIPADLNDLFRPPYENDEARIHSNSWGLRMAPGDRQFSYSTQSLAFEIDQFVWEHPDMVICFSAGNDGTDAVNTDGISDDRQIGATAAAKNCITVGASESVRPESGADFLTYGAIGGSKWPREPLKSDLMADNAEGMVAFSSRGPTAENRIKPDVVAPGTSILSTRSRAAPPPDSTFGRSSDVDWFFDSGTSMSCPLVAGCAAVVRETLVKNGRPSPSAALIKALLINGAVNLGGQYSPNEARPAPNPDSGWGRVNLAGSIIIPGPKPVTGDGQDLSPFNKGDPPATITVHVRADPPETEVDMAHTGVRTLKVTLVWSDPPEPNGKLQNDLDLVVIAPNGTERYGNMGTAKGRDSVNNVEQVVWENIPSGDERTPTRRAPNTAANATPLALRSRRVAISNPVRNTQIIAEQNRPAVVVGLTPVCPYGLGPCWGGASEGLKSVKDIAAVRPVPDQINSVAFAYLKEDILPDIDIWRREFADSANGSYGMRGIEMTISGVVTMERIGSEEVLTLAGTTTRPVVVLMPYQKTSTIEWNIDAQAPQPVTALEMAAYSSLASIIAGQSAGLAVEVTGPLHKQDANNFSLDVRRFERIEGLNTSSRL
ncbi:hypothetical protein LTR22_019099 [Elasticomyces elasticus]|nr:hypothetical protein LTR22_019099 [Elasticomyces elasticus]KAK4933116.1 hypothetical protein LTR49_000600 [Elasticomyces elasticus]KAK5764015.1 hypothetical protein LTS12_005925 [Elasticomyces elasticus]